MGHVKQSMFFLIHFKGGSKDRNKRLVLKQKYEYGSRERLVKKLKGRWTSVDEKKRIFIRSKRLGLKQKYKYGRRKRLVKKLYVRKR